jgi:hypothetical protein
MVDDHPLNVVVAGSGEPCREVCSKPEAAVRRFVGAVEAAGGLVTEPPGQPCAFVQALRVAVEGTEKREPPPFARLG